MKPIFRPPSAAAKARRLPNATVAAPAAEAIIRSLRVTPLVAPAGVEASHLPIIQSSLCFLVWPAPRAYLDSLSNSSNCIRSNALDRTAVEAHGLHSRQRGGPNNPKHKCQAASSCLAAGYACR